jgi:hypothetical protein
MSPPNIVEGMDRIDQQIVLRCVQARRHPLLAKEAKLGRESMGHGSVSCGFRYYRASCALNASVKPAEHAAGKPCNWRSVH